MTPKSKPLGMPCLLFSVCGSFPLPVSLTTHELQDRRQSQSVSPPGSQRGGGARSLSLGAILESRPELILKARPTPGAASLQQLGHLQ